MPSKNMIKKGKRRQTVKHDYRVHRDAVREAAATLAAAAEPLPAGATPPDTAPVAAPRASAEPAIAVLDDLEAEDGVRSFLAETAAKGRRLDAFLARALPEVSRARVQLLIESGGVRVEGKPAKASLRLEGGERIEIEGEPQPPPLRAEPEDIPLAIVYEDDDLAVIDKPAGMAVHAGAGDAEHNRGTLVNALLFHFGQALSGEGGALRPGIVHRLDKETSGLIVVAKNDATHRALAEMFEARSLRKVYIALVHGEMGRDEGTVDLPIGRDPVRRVRMTARRGPGKRRAGRGQPLARAGADRGEGRTRAVGRIHAGRGPDRNRADAPDPGTPGGARSPGRGRHALRRTRAAAGHDSRRRGRGRGDGNAGTELPPCSRTGPRASRHGGGTGVAGGAAGGLGGLSDAGAAGAGRGQAQTRERGAAGDGAGW